MKKLSALTIALCALSVPVLSFAQTNAPVTRAQVRAELVQLEQAGYDPSAGEGADYPTKLQAAEAKVAAKQAQRASAVGDPTSATTLDGSCTGPVSFCNVYFGN